MLGLPFLMKGRGFNWIANLRKANKDKVQKDTAERAAGWVGP